MERNEKCFCGSGKKYKKCHYRINGESKLADMYRINAAFDEACKNWGIANCCPQGCSECCKDYFFVSENEFLLIVEELLQRGEDISGYVRKAQECLAYIKKNFPKLTDKLDAMMPSGGNEKLSSVFFKDTENPRGLPPCIFLNKENKCSIYNVRPIICRTYGTSETCGIIGNSSVKLQEHTNLMYNTIIQGDSGQDILKRPYPLFYWFSYFLIKPRDYLVKAKIEKLKVLSEEEYYKFTRSLYN